MIQGYAVNKRSQFVDKSVPLVLTFNFMYSLCDEVCQALIRPISSSGSAENVCSLDEGIDEEAFLLLTPEYVFNIEYPEE
ncbi:hypothetical protein Avbf_17388 [Armadillidium vulgare]|nr:hypothetical protein Avbf_17388 [Armadillidium vulgare]